MDNKEARLGSFIKGYWAIIATFILWFSAFVSMQTEIKEMRGRFDRAETRQDAQDQNIAQLIERVKGVEVRVENIDKNVERIVIRLDSMSLVREEDPVPVISQASVKPPVKKEETVKEEIKGEEERQSRILGGNIELCEQQGLYNGVLECIASLGL